MRREPLATKFEKPHHYHHIHVVNRFYISNISMKRVYVYVYIHIFTYLYRDSAILLNILHTFSSHSLLYRILDILHSLVRVFSCYKAADGQSSSNVDEFSSTGFFYLIHCSYILRLAAVQPFETFM